MNILEKVKSLREQMYAAVEADDIDKIMEISKEWDSLDNGVTSEQLIFEASLVKNTNEEILKKKAYKLSYEEVKKFKELVRKENTYEDFLFGWYFKWDKTSKTYDEVNDEIWDKIEAIKEERMKLRKSLKGGEVENVEETEKRIAELVYESSKWKIYSEYLGEYFLEKRKKEIEKVHNEKIRKDEELTKRIQNENLNQGLFKK